MGNQLDRCLTFPAGERAQTREEVLIGKGGGGGEDVRVHAPVYHGLFRDRRAFHTAQVRRSRARSAARAIATGWLAWEARTSPQPLPRPRRARRQIAIRYSRVRTKDRPKMIPVWTQLQRRGNRTATPRQSVPPRRRRGRAAAAATRSPAVFRATPRSAEAPDGARCAAGRRGRRGTASPRRRDGPGAGTRRAGRSRSRTAARGPGCRPGWRAR
jgi:hypothetical protein